MSEENVIFVGKKPTMNYVLAIVMQFNNSGIDRIAIKARGKAISKAVDIAEITKRKFVQTAKYEKIELNTEVLDGENGPSNVSSIEIVLVK
ncbi:DNA-binding protein Alba [Ferroplasma sp.]|uniref:DNA-binding protein Alba n=1 Tax=Ferroplasma sp. TaxID=2591003 RepID=UPI00307EBA05